MENCWWHKESLFEWTVFLPSAWCIQTPDFVKPWQLEETHSCRQSPRRFKSLKWDNNCWFSMRRKNGQGSQTLVSPTWMNYTESQIIIRKLLGRHGIRTKELNLYDSNVYRQQVVISGCILPYNAVCIGWDQTDNTSWWTKPNGPSDCHDYAPLSTIK